MKPSLPFFLLFFFFSAAAMAQDWEDVLQMKDGGITRGIILEKTPGKGVKIQIGPKEVVFIPMDEIEKISREKVETPLKVERRFMKVKGFTSQLDFGYDKSSTHADMDRFHLAFMNGYRFNHYFSLGAGPGLRYYYGVRDILIPITGSVRFNFLKRRINPFLMVSAGYSFDSINDEDQIQFKNIGSILNSQAGISIALKGKSCISFGLGFERQQFDLSRSSSSYFISYSNRSEKVNTGAWSYFMSFGF
jgi:hypothetical protein